MDMEAQSKLRSVRVSARKARLVADLIRGRDVGEALEILLFTRKKSAPLLKCLVESAVANAEFLANRDGGKIDIDNLVIKKIFVDEGPTLRRFRPRARGMATKILKRTSHITVVVGES
jgi:large subunit ribosomal protein L22